MGGYNRMGVKSSFTPTKWELEEAENVLALLKGRGQKC